MEKNEEFYKIKGIFESFSEKQVQIKQGKGLLFNVYLTDTMRETDIDALELSVRANNCLKRSGIHTIGDFCSLIHCSSDLKRIRNCGKTCITEILDNLFAYQYSVLKPESRTKFLIEVIEMNRNNQITEI